MDPYNLRGRSREIEVLSFCSLLCLFIFCTAYGGPWSSQINKKRKETERKLGCLNNTIIIYTKPNINHLFQVVISKIVLKVCLYISFHRGREDIGEGKEGGREDIGEERKRSEGKQEGEGKRRR